MTGVEDVAGAAAVAAQDVAGALGHDLPRCEAHGGIEVALDGLAREPVASDVEGDAPVDPHHVGTRRAHERQQLAGPDTEVDAWHPGGRSEEHTSELQSPMRKSYGVFCL